MADKQVPLMQQPGYVYREHKHVLARRVLVGDIILEKRHGKEEERHTVKEIEVTTHMTYIKVVGQHKTFCLGLNTDRVWVAREGKR